jgi:molecular chaperone GrpE
VTSPTEEPVNGGEPQQQGQAPEEVEPEVVEGEVVEELPVDLADGLLAQALNGAEIEEQFRAAEAEGSAGEPQEGRLASLTADLQRVHAEYSNYRKRVERDRELVRDRAVEGVLVDLLPILDDVERARAHDELVGGFRSVGDALAALAGRYGLEPFGAEGDPFDPTQHEALMREEREGITEPTVVAVLQLGYLMNGRIVRPARVCVAGTD